MTAARKIAGQPLSKAARAARDESEEQEEQEATPVKKGKRASVGGKSRREWFFLPCLFGEEEEGRRRGGGWSDRFDATFEWGARGSCRREWN